MSVALTQMTMRSETCRAEAATETATVATTLAALPAAILVLWLCAWYAEPLHAQTTETVTQGHVWKTDSKRTR